MKKAFLLSVFTSALLSAVISYATTKHISDSSAPTRRLEVKNSQTAEPVFDKVMKTKTLRCGYMTWPPLSGKNLKTGKMEGVYVDMTEELARGYGWKVDWVEEITLSDFSTALNARRIDAFCGPISATQQRTQAAYFSRPNLFGPIRAYVRADDTRFDANPETVNSPDVTLSVMEGEFTSIIARTQFPQSKILEITQLQGGSQLFENVASGKADIIFQDPFTFSYYNKENPGKLRQAGFYDIGVFPANYAIKMGENKLKWLFDSALDELLNRGYIKKLSDQYGLTEMDLYLPADNYKKQ
jgi:polar amino acid transport system substrate-binding protein